MDAALAKLVPGTPHGNHGEKTRGMASCFFVDALPMHNSVLRASMPAWARLAERLLPIYCSENVERVSWHHLRRRFKLKRPTTLSSCSTVPTGVVTTYSKYRLCALKSFPQTPM